MRNDMHKLLCERSRTGGYGRPGNRNCYVRASMKHNVSLELDDEGELDEQPRYVKPKRVTISRTEKNLNDFLSPLKGWLIKQAGRRWNDVFSELCTMLPSGMHADHIRQHVDGYIERHVVLVDGVPCTAVTGFWQREDNINTERGSYSPINRATLYVDPIDNILKWGKHTSNFGWRGLRTLGRPARYKRPVDPNVHIVGDSRYDRVNGIWYASINTGRVNSLPDGGTWVTNSDGTVSFKQRYRIEPVYIHQQLNTRELRKLGLVNG